MTPTLTVLLPAYNAGATLPAAMESILRQSYGDLELLVMDDGSADGTAQTLKAYTDRRIRIIRQEKNRGLTAVLNEGIDTARGQFIARMDADDVAHRRRLEHQLALLHRHPEVGICGTWFRVRSGWRRTIVRTPVHHELISANLFFRSPFAHPSVMFRRSLLNEHRLRYEPSAADAEDFDLWVRARNYTRFSNVPRVLLDYFVHPAQISASRLRAQRRAAEEVRLRQLSALLPAATAEQQTLHLRVCDAHHFTSREDLMRARDWLDTLESANAHGGLFDRNAFREALASAWAHCCQRARPPLGTEVIALHFNRRFSGFGMERVRDHVRVASRAILRQAQ